MKYGMSSQEVMEMSKEKEFYPMTRVEGHGGIRVLVEDDEVKDAKVDIYEGPRLLEPLVEGKDPEEVVSITCRVCAICSISHRYVCLNALEKALDLDVGEKVKTMRELMQFGEIIESNSLHVYMLSLPDLMEADSVIELKDEYEDVVSRGLKTKAFGNKIMKVISGRITHGENPVIGGYGRWPDRKDLIRLKEEALALLDGAIETVELLGSLDIPDYATSPTKFMCVDAGENKYGFAGDKILISDGAEFPVDDYRDVLDEGVVNHSFAKRVKHEGDTFTVGAIARIINTGMKLDGEAWRLYTNYYGDEWAENPMYNIIAQAIEIVHCLEKLPKLVEKILDIEDEEIVEPNSDTGRGTAAVEAPRGTLYHSYEVEDGKVVDGDILTPTAQNLDDMEKYILEGARNLYEDLSEDDLQYKLDTIARAYDPCISCATHMTEIIDS